MACEAEQTAYDDAMNQEAAAWGILCVKYMEVSAAYAAYSAAMQVRMQKESDLHICQNSYGGGGY